MSIHKKYIGLDVSKEKIVVAIANEGTRDAAQYWGSIPHTKEAVTRLINRLRKNNVVLDTCYEAGPTGFVLYRWLLELDVHCTVVAPSMTPQRAGDRIKTDKRDAIRLAQLYRAAELTPVYVPTPEDEAFRDLIRAREDAKQDMNRHKQRLGKFLLRHQIQPPPGTKPWTHKYEEWLDTLKFSNASQRMTFQEYRQTIWETKERLERYEKEIQQQAEVVPQAPLINALQALRGVAVLTASTLASEIGTILRFPTPQAFMCYCGLVPSEISSGNSRWQGSITKAGNAHLRRVIVDSAGSYRHSPSIKRKMRERIKGIPPEVQSIAWAAQTRLHKKYKMLINRGVNKQIAKVAVARELAGFIWSVAHEFEKLQIHNQHLATAN